MPDNFAQEILTMFPLEESPCDITGYHSYTTEEMMEESCITADEWRLGEDSPWKAMLETEDKNIKTNAAIRKRELSAIDEDI
jgi:hypothetical protein